MATSAAPADPAQDRKLGDIYAEAYHQYMSLDQLDLASNSPEYQLEVKKCAALMEDATRLVSMVGLFSDNESEEEIATEHLKYLLLPYFLGQLVQKKTGGDRNEIVRVAEVYFKDYLSRCETYGLHSVPSTSQALVATAAAAGASNGATDKMAELTMMAHQRNSKLEQYRLKKELDEEIKKIRILMEREHIDDTLRRDFYLKLVRASCLEAADELRSLAQEQQMLGMMRDPELSELLHSAAGGCTGSHGHRHGGPQEPLRPVIITKDAFQKAVYGAGYPSLPTMSVDEFYENRVAEGIFPDPNVRRDPNSTQARAMRGDTAELDEAEDIQKEADEENDDEVYLARARNMDEFKDEVRRGDGNRHNRS